MQKRIRIVCVLILAWVVMCFGTRCASSDETVLATYAGGTVTLGDVQAYAAVAEPAFLESEMLTAALKALDDPQTLMHETVSNIAFYDLLQRTQHDPRSLAGISREALQLLARFSLHAYAGPLWMESLAADVRVSEEELEAGKKSHAKDISQPPHVKVAYLFVESPEQFPQEKARLDELRQKPDFASNFENYARQARDLHRGSLTGGVIEDYVSGKYNPVLDEKVSSAEVGKLSEPFSTHKGTFIIKVLERKAAVLLPEEQAKAIITGILTREKLAVVQKQRLQELRKRHKIKEWSGATAPSPDTVIADVDGTQLVLATYLEAYPEKAGSAKTNAQLLADVAKEFIEGELIVGDLAKRATQDDGQMQQKMKMFERRSYAVELLTRYYARVVSASEDEARAYYEQHKAIYHRPTPKKLRAVIFHLPTEKQEPSRIAREKITRQIRQQAADFIQHTTKESFEKDAEQLLAKVKGVSSVTLETLGPYEELPAGWEGSRQLDQMTVGEISPLATAPDSYVVFKVIEDLPYTIPPYEEVREKPMSVVQAQKAKEVRQKLKAEVLAAGSFKIVSAKSQ